MLRLLLFIYIFPLKCDVHKGRNFSLCSLMYKIHIWLLIEWKNAYIMFFISLWCYILFLSDLWQESLMFSWEYMSTGKCYPQAYGLITLCSGLIIKSWFLCPDFFPQGVISFTKVVLYNSKLIPVPRNIRIMY